MGNNNMDLWNALCVTDKARTKNFTKGGGFSGTAINPTYIKEQLTKQFGPCGIGWGFHVKDERYVTGHTDGKNTVQIHVVRIGFWYVLSDKRSEEIDSYGQTTFVGQNKNGWFTDEEAPKKSLTDAFTKAASDIGVAADIHGGHWNDNKYISNKEKNDKPSLASHATVPEVNGQDHADGELTPGQKTLLVRKAGAQGMDEEELNLWLLKEYGIESVDTIPLEKYAAIKAKVEL